MIASISAIFFLHHQVVVEKKLMREKNLSRHDVGREKFLCEVGALFLTLTNSSSVVICQVLYCHIDKHCFNTYVGFSAQIFVL